MTNKTIAHSSDVSARPTCRRGGGETVANQNIVTGKPAESAVTGIKPKCNKSLDILISAGKSVPCMGAVQLYCSLAEEEKAKDKQSSYRK